MKSLSGYGYPVFETLVKLSYKEKSMMSSRF